MFINDFDIQIQSDEISVLFNYDDFEEEEDRNDDDADCFCDDD